MSRIGKVPVNIYEGVTVSIEKGCVNLEGPKGKLSLNIPLGITVEQKENALCVNKIFDTKENRAKHGTIRAILENNMVGVTEGHKKALEIRGVGFRSQAQDNKLVLSVGLSHPVELQIPDGVKVASPKPTSIMVEGTDKALVGAVAASIRKIKPPEPYKGKGIRYVGEFVRTKQGKSVTK